MHIVFDLENLIEEPLLKRRGFFLGPGQALFGARKK
jgi:hypothetical protein